MRIRSRSHLARWGARLLLACWLSTAPAWAQSPEVGRAEQLFSAGKQLMAQKRPAEACPLLAQSFQLDPATGSLLALAICHEMQGSLVLAHGEYLQVVERSRHEGRNDRASVAQARAAQLEATLPRLTIDASAVLGLPGLDVRVNGQPLAVAQFEQPLWVEQGALTIGATAPGKRPFQVQLAVGPVPSGTRGIGTQPSSALSVSIPMLESLPSATPIRTSSAPRAAPRVPLSTHTAQDLGPMPLTRAQWTGIGLLSAGAVSLAMGGWYTLRAVHGKHASSANCTGNLCEPVGRAERIAARSAGNAATATLILGGSLVTAGVLTYLLGRPDHASSHARSHRLAAAPIVSAHAAGAVLEGRF